MNENIEKVIELLASIDIYECWTDIPCSECNLNHTGNKLGPDSKYVDKSICDRIQELAEIIQDMREGGAI